MSHGPSMANVCFPDAELLSKYTKLKAVKSRALG